MNEISSPEDAFTLRDVASRLDDLLREVRRQGRAAVAAQAAAESCLEAVQAAAQAAAAPDEEDAEEGPEPADVSWAAAVFPVADALDRILAQASAMAERRAASQASGLWALLRRRPDPDPEIVALAEGLRVLRAQLASALESAGITADRRAGIAVDPNIHRVVEVRPERAASPEAMVLEVIRPAYLAGERVLREAEVVSSQPAKRQPMSRGGQ